MRISNFMFILLFVLGVKGQNINIEFISSNNTPYLLGETTKKALLRTPYRDWFKKEYKNYPLKDSTIHALKGQGVGFKIEIYYATWCGDSQREVPRFVKILDRWGLSNKNLKMIALSSYPHAYKQSPLGLEQGKNIHRVPTFIVYKNETEIGRIVEFPVKSLEEDLLKIITHGGYVPNYEIVEILNDIYEKAFSWKEVKNQLNANFESLKQKSKNWRELYTYARVLGRKNKNKEAIAALELNHKIYSEETNSLILLCQLYENIADMINASICIEKALRVNPNLDTAKKWKDKLKMEN